MASASTSLAGSISARRLARSNTFAGGESGLLDAIEAWIERGAGNAERLRVVAARLAQLKEKAEAKAAEMASAAELQPVKEDSGMADASAATNAPSTHEEVPTRAEVAIPDLASAPAVVVQDNTDKLLPELAPAKVSHDPDTAFTREAALVKLKSNDASNYFELEQCDRPIVRNFARIVLFIQFYDVSEFHIFRKLALFERLRMHGEEILGHERLEFLVEFGGEFIRSGGLPFPAPPYGALDHLYTTVHEPNK